MTEMSKVEEVGRALAEQEGCTYDPFPYDDRARAAIAAMKKPTPAMQIAVSAQWGHRTWSQYAEVIDAALKE